MATRIVQRAILGLPIQAGFLPRWYFLMTDGTIWMLLQGVWTQGPAVPGGRIISEIGLYPGLGDTVYACCTDGTIWSAAVTTPMTWAQATSTPP